MARTYHVETQLLTYQTLVGSSVFVLGLVAGLSWGAATHWLNPFQAPANVAWAPASAFLHATPHETAGGQTLHNLRGLAP